MSLRTYAEKRNFRKTPEPSGSAHKESRSHRFVIQKHSASHLHYDFRLEIGGVLKSWAVPKGVPYAKGEKRLAMHVEDHPVSYRDFEGIIPKGQYGGGTVMVWDYGTFKPLSKAPSKELAGGKLHFVLHGKKLSGEWYLVRLRNGDKEWLLIRGGDDMKPVSKKLDDTSALSGKNMKQLGAGTKVWQSNRSQGDSKLHKKLLPFFQPMMAKLVKEPPAGNWTYEIKYDGFRALAFLNADHVQLMSRNEKDLSGRFPEILSALKQLSFTNTILDGEIVALDSKGRSSFQLLQAYEMGQEKPPLVYFIFDMPQDSGQDLRSSPIESRRDRLHQLFRKQKGTLQLSQVLEGDPADLLKQAHKLGLEGLIGKREGSLYEAGKRTGAWIKLKTHLEQEFVIGGFTNPSGGRRHFGAVLTGVYKSGKLIFTGKVGTGFNEALLQTLIARFRKLEIRDCPFHNLPESTTGRYGSGITRAEMARCHWLKPSLVCQIRFSEWTRDGKLRQPVFLGLRDDKKPSDVKREVAS
jgi:bifunctional non-homologous end joining protein LigD